ncbi:MAG TPA: hypothetical protein VN496_03265 [Burkholderiales bacterium]|nr:hypothetical protein [Burkholderiales bacterium]
MLVFLLRIPIWLIGFFLLACAPAGLAQDSVLQSLQSGPAGDFQFAPDKSRLTLQISPYVYHVHHGVHNDEPRMIGLEWEPAGSWLEYGATYFRNSFYQDSAYVYVGKRWFAADNEQGAFANVSGGLMYGYRGENADKVPFNHHGVGLAIIPAVGYQYRSFNTQLVFLGTAALMITFGFDLPR